MTNVSELKCKVAYTTMDYILQHLLFFINCQQLPLKLNSTYLQVMLNFLSTLNQTVTILSYN